jgi:hypothetical protein
VVMGPGLRRDDEHLIFQNRHTVMQAVPAAADGGLLPTSVAWFESRAPVGLIDDAPALL